MKTYIIDNGSALIHQLTELFSSSHPIVINYGDVHKMKIPKKSLVVLSGGHGIPVLWHEKEFHDELQLIKTHDGPIIGICLGMQLIAHAYGSSLHLLKHPATGVKKVEPQGTNNDIVGLTPQYVFEHHHWSVPKTHAPLQTLATSMFGVEMLRHVNKPIYGMQFHPESAEGRDGRRILRRLMVRITTE